MNLVVGLDLSLTGTGVARIKSRPLDEWPEKAPTVEHQRFGSDAAGIDLHARGRRLRLLAAQIVTRCEYATLVGVEQPSYNSTGGSAHDRSGLWWLIMERLTRNGIPCYEVTPVHLKMYATGAGKGGKDGVLAETSRRYAAVAPHLSTNDEADALIIASMGWAHLTGTPLVPLPATHTRTLDRIRWPSTTTERGHRA